MILVSNKKIISASLLFLVLAMGLPNLALAHPVGATGTAAFWMPGQPLVPCGGRDVGGNRQPDCTKCDLLHLLKHLIDMLLIFVAPIIGTLFFVVAGVMMMLGGSNPGMLSQGKSIFKNTFIGILIMFMAWLITNTLIQTFATNNLPLPDGSTWTSSNWWSFTCGTP